MMPSENPATTGPGETRDTWWTHNWGWLSVLLAGVLLYVPLAGSYGFFDPWETRYSEVARIMAERNEYISMRWEGAPTEYGGFGPSRS